MDDSRTLILEEELLIVRHSGEIPEIAFHAALHYLCEDPEGPGLILSEEEYQGLLDGALERAREIVLRDLDPANRDLGLYRGVRRSIHNWRRYLDFCRRRGRQGRWFAPEVRQALRDFLDRELADVAGGRRSSCLNCTASELMEFWRELGGEAEDFLSDWSSLCPREAEG